MTYEEVVKKLEKLPECYIEEVALFIDFLLFKSRNETQPNRSDGALAELDSLDLHLPANSPTPASLVRRDRDGFDKGGRLR